MVLKYTGMSIGRLWEGMLVTVPTKWETSEFGNVVEDAWKEIHESLYDKGIYACSGRNFKYVFSSFFGCNKSYLTYWEKL